MLASVQLFVCLSAL